MMSVLIFPWLQLSHDLSYWSPSLSLPVFPLLTENISVILRKIFLLLYVILSLLIKSNVMLWHLRIKSNPYLSCFCTCTAYAHYFLTFSSANLFSIICSSTCHHIVIILCFRSHLLGLKARIFEENCGCIESGTSWHLLFLGVCRHAEPGHKCDSDANKCENQNGHKCEMQTGRNS